MSIPSTPKATSTLLLDNGANYDFYNVDLLHKPKCTKRLFQLIWKRVKKLKKHRGKYSDASTGTNSTASISIHSSISIGVSEEDYGTVHTPLIQTRFLHSRAIDSIHDIEFVKDKVAKEIVDIYASSLVCSQDEYDDEKGTGVSHVETGI